MLLEQGRSLEKGTAPEAVAPKPVVPGIAQKRSVIVILSIILN